MTNYAIATIGFYIFMTMFLYIDYKIFVRSGDSIFLKDKSEIEKDLREIQKLEIKARLKELKDKQ